jgi:hypothetical protein
MLRTRVLTNQKIKLQAHYPERAVVRPPTTPHPPHGETTMRPLITPHPPHGETVVRPPVTPHPRMARRWWPADHSALPHGETVVAR